MFVQKAACSFLCETNFSVISVVSVWHKNYFCVTYNIGVKILWILISRFKASPSVFLTLGLSSSTEGEEIDFRGICGRNRGGLLVRAPTHSPAATHKCEFAANFLQPTKHVEKKLYWNIGYWIHFFSRWREKCVKICLIFYIIY